jgi:hypothetical protein
VKLLILFLISISCMADKSFFNPQPTQSEFVLYMPDLSKKFDALANGPNKCSQETYRKLEQIITEVFIWYHFQNSVESLTMLNTMTSKLEVVEGEQPEKIVYTVEDALPEDEITEEQVVEQLNLWRQRECTVMGKGKKLWNKILNVRP